MANQIITLFTNQTTNGTSNTFRPNHATEGDANTHRQNRYLKIDGVLDGARITLENRNPDLTWSSTGIEDSDEIGGNVPGVFPFEYNDYLLFRLVISNAGGSTDITAWFINGNAT